FSLGSESRTIVQALRPGGQVVRRFAGRRGGGGPGAMRVVADVVAVDVVELVGSGAVCVCCRLEAAGEIATIVSSLALERSVSHQADAAPAAAATSSASSAGQIQSPGYRPKRRRHAEPSAETSPPREGSLPPHSRQY